MKHMIITVLICFQLGDTYSQCSTSPDFYDDFSTNIGWSIINKTSHPLTTNVSIIATGVLKYTNLKDGREQRIVKQLPFMLNDKFWVAECRIKYLAGVTPSHIIMSFTENNNDTYYTQTGQLGECSPFAGVNTNQDAIFCYIQSQSKGSPKKILVGCKDGLNIFNNLNSGINISVSNVNYYVRLQRTDISTGVISVYFNSAMTAHVPGSPQCFNMTAGIGITNLNHVQFGAGTGGNCNRTLTMEIDDIKIYNGYSPCPLPLTSSFTTNNVVCFGSSIVCDGSSSSSGSIIPINNYVWIVRECDINGNSIPSSQEWWSPFYPGSPGLYTIPTINGPQLQCGKYYKVSLALQNCGNIWATSSKIVFVECKPIVNISATNQYLCDHGSTTLTANVNTTGNPCTYTWTKVSPTFQSIMVNSPLNQITVMPSVTSTYQVLVNSSNGCSSSATITVTVYPTSYSKNISTGYINSASNPNPANIDFPLSAYGDYDDEWKCMNNPVPYNPPNLNPICVSTMNNSFLPTSNARWVTGAASQGSLNPDNQGVIHVPVGPYIYEYQFTIPSNYTTCTLTINKFGVDNTGELYLDGNLITSLTTPTIQSNYSVGTTSPITVPIVGAGSHIIQCKVFQEDKWTAFFVEGFINGQCN